MIVYLDTETIPSQRDEAKAIAVSKVSIPGNISKPETIAKWEEEKRPGLEEEQWRKTALNGAWGEIACICWAIDSGPVNSALRPDATKDESKVLVDFFDDIELQKQHHNLREITWVGHNISGFDLRFLWQRAVVLGVKPPIKLRQDARPWSDFVFDTMHEWSGRDYTKLTDLCAALRVDVGHEDTIDGSQVWDCYQRGELQTILNHCIADVERVRECHKRMTFVAR